MTYTRPRFYYAGGTSHFFNFGVFVTGLDPSDLTQAYINLGIFNISAAGITTTRPSVNLGNVAGLDGKTFLWNGDDPFPKLLDSDLWETKSVPYPASAAFIGPSIDIGAAWVMADIATTPPGTPFALGGYSQGAAVMSRVYQETRAGLLMDRRQDLRAMITFGNPMREEGHTFPKSSGYSGSIDIPDPTYGTSVTGGHGCFPSLDSMSIFDPYVSRFARLQNTDNFVWDFTMPNEIISGIGNSNDGNRIVAFTKESLRFLPIGALIDFLSPDNVSVLKGLMPSLTKAPKFAPQDENGGVILTDALTGATKGQSGGGHVMYPCYPPPNADGSFTPGADTCYQKAAKYLRQVGQQIYDELNPTPPTLTIPPSYVWSSTW